VKWKGAREQQNTECLGRFFVGAANHTSFLEWEICSSTGQVVFHLAAPNVRSTTIQVLAYRSSVFSTKCQQWSSAQQGHCSASKLAAKNEACSAHHMMKQSGGFAGSTNSLAWFAFPSATALVLQLALESLALEIPKSLVCSEGLSSFALFTVCQIL